MLNIGIIGLGGISASHISQIEEIKEARISAICDIDKEKLEKIGNMLNIPKEQRFTDYKELVDSPVVDAVEICTPNHLHIPMAKYAAQKGKCVEIEKPISTDSQGVDELMSLIREKDIPNMMCFSYRFTPAVRYAKAIIEKGALGKIINVNVEYLKSSAFIKDRKLEWRFIKKFAGSGVLGDLGVHLIDMTRFLLGEFKTVYAMKNIVVKERMREDSTEYGNVETEDIVSFIARLEEDIIANFLVTRCALGNENTIKYEIYGTQGVISFNLNNPEELTLCVGEIDMETQSLHTVKVPPQYYCGQEATFVDHVTGKDSLYLPDISEGALCQKIVDAILKSADEGAVIAL